MFETLAALYAKIAATTWLHALTSSVLVAALASIVRIIFSPNKGWVHSMGTFFGGVLVGTLVGYIVSDIESLRGYNSAIVAAASIGAREVVEWLLDRLQELKRLKFAYLLSDAKYNDYVNSEQRENVYQSPQKDISPPPQVLNLPETSLSPIVQPPGKFPDTDLELDNWAETQIATDKSGENK